MSKRIVEGFWDCSYCGKKGIGGLTKTCPSCGNPQGSGVKFYMDRDNIKYLDSEKAKNYGKGADWQCDFCGSYNHYDQVTCSNCGSNKILSQKDYFGHDINRNDNEKEKNTNFIPVQPKKEGLDTSSINSSTSNKDYSRTSQSYFEKINKLEYIKWVGISLAAILLVITLVFLFKPRDYQALIFGNSWERSITIQEYRWVDDDSWYFAPVNARNVEVRSEVYTYDQVIDHYESVEVQKSRQVYDHTEYENHVTYSDNGDGTFTEHSYQTSHDVYRTEYYYETEQKPVYKSVPRYENHYYYEIQKWVYDRTEKASNTNNYTPNWPNYSLNDKERVSQKLETYTLKIKTDKNEYNVQVPESYLYKYKIDNKVTITVQAGFVTKINGEKIVFN